jgi:membrane-associated phospholipid phosphatase
VIQIVHLIFSDGRLSPSLVLEPVYKLTELVPWITAKDASSRSFPGDHATVLLLFSVFMHVFCGKSYKLLYLLVVIFTLPRLVSGAHWLTDVLIGGGATVLIVASIALILDLPKRFSSAVSRYIQPITQRLGVE